jgi:two-component system CheB/CheR fusion protein
LTAKGNGGVVMPAVKEEELESGGEETTTVDHGRRGAHGEPHDAYDGAEPHDHERETDEEVDPPGLEAMLEYLHRSRGFDFTGYKRTTIGRRIRRRMQTLGVKTYPEYVDYLEVRPDEFPQLFNMILINVTGFFRDSVAWAYVRTLITERIAQESGKGPIRIWSAGCASGEEPFTLAMLLADALGIEKYAERVKIYATDVDEDALAQARLATYSPKSVESVPPELLEKYFTKNNSSYVFNKELRRAVIFGRHDLVQDAPISRIDLIACRNTLMYFNAETQTRILNRLHFALKDDGILFLGKAEMLLTHANLFTSLDVKLRVFGRTKGRVRERAASDDRGADASGGSGDDRTRLHRAAFERAPTAQLVLDTEGHVALINHRAAHLFSLTQQDLMRPFHELEVSYRPAELRSGLDRVRKERRPLHLREVERTLASGERTFLDIEIVPLLGENGAVVGTQLSFSDITDAHNLQVELRKANVELETAHEELQSTSEELETTNEELQSTVEELETTNEELQSTNEELETMNEELQSTNEELQAMNEELRQRGEELVGVSNFFGSILATLDWGLAVLDHDLLVRVWNPRMEDLWGLRADEVESKPFVTLDIGLPIEHLAGAIRSTLATGVQEKRTVDCTNRRGKAVRCTVTVTPLKAAPRKGVTLVVEELPA